MTTVYSPGGAPSPPRTCLREYFPLSSVVPTQSIPFVVPRGMKVTIAEGRGFASRVTAPPAGTVFGSTFGFLPADPQPMTAATRIRQIDQRHISGDSIS